MMTLGKSRRMGIGTISHGRKKVAEGKWVPVPKGRQHPTETPQFKAWFGDSKVVDRNGKPTVVYHGGNTPITSFDTSSIRGDLGVAYFTDDPDIAGKYAILGGIDETLSSENYLSTGVSRAPDRAAQVYPLYLKIENPLDLNMDWGDVVGVIGKKTIIDMVSNDSALIEMWETGEINEYEYETPEEWLNENLLFYLESVVSEKLDDAIGKAVIALEEEAAE